MVCYLGGAFYPKWVCGAGRRCSPESSPGLADLYARSARVSMAWWISPIPCTIKRSPPTHCGRIWLVTFTHDDLGYLDDETCRLEPIENPFGPKVLPMCSE